MRFTIKAKLPIKPKPIAAHTCVVCEVQGIWRQATTTTTIGTVCRVHTLSPTFDPFI